MIVLDASAPLALMEQDQGWDDVATAAAVEDAPVSSANYLETLQKAGPGWACSPNWSTRVSVPSGSR